MKSALSITIFLFLSFFLKAQSAFELDYDIKKQIRENLFDTIGNNSKQAKFVETWYNQLDSLPTEKLHLIQNEFDEVQLIKYDHKYKENLIIFWGNFFDSTKQDFEKSRVTLSKKQYEPLLRILNNPSTYNWNECGSPIAEYEIAILKSNEVIFRIVLSCDLNQVHLSEKNIIIKYGNMLNVDGFNPVAELISKIEK